MIVSSYAKAVLSMALGILLASCGGSRGLDEDADDTTETPVDSVDAPDDATAEVTPDGDDDPDAPGDVVEDDAGEEDEVTEQDVAQDDTLVQEDPVEEDAPPGCTHDEECDDGVPCTQDECRDDGSCSFTPRDELCADDLLCSLALGCVQCLDDGDCDDGLFCTGVETCDASGGCRAGLPPCDDSVSCTRDLCDEDADGCSVDLDDTRCDDTLLCTGTELCDPFVGDPSTGCTSGTPVTCDDAVDCTRDECSEVALGCVHVPVHTSCDVMTQLCDPVLGCITLECTSDGECDNGIACDGVETCATYTCTSGTPVTCDDAISCTEDTCVEPTGACQFLPRDGRCDDHLVCNGIETCDPVLGDATTGCLDGTAPTCLDAHDCTVDSCSESAGGCVHVPDDPQCQDLDMCNGVEACNVAVGCVPGHPVDCEDLVDCTLDTCIPLTGACLHAPVDASCNDGRACSGTETCHETSGCQPGTPVDCDDAVACTVDTCQEPGGTCDSNPDHGLCESGEVCLSTGCTVGTACSDASTCDDGLFCNGEEVCTGVCGPGAPPVCDDDIPCTVDTCSNSLGACVYTPRDEDGDGHADFLCGGDDCDDSEPLVNPDATEVCDGVDNDCDGSTDFGLIADGMACTASSECCSGLCAGSICTVGWGTCEGLGEDCVVSADCCSGRCELVPGGVMQCVANEACLILGTSCEFSAQCCTTFCQGGVCSAGECYQEGDSCGASEECCSDDCVLSVCQDVGIICRPEGETCTVSGVCCSGYCDTSIGRCVQLSLCSPSGSICVDDFDCCTGYCEYDDVADDSGTCLFVGTCTVVGQPCTGSSECCSNSCADPGFGYPVCVYLSGCRPYGEICTSATDCCSGLCEPDGPVSRCQNPPGCQPDGEVCGDVATNNCCNLKSDGCRPTVAGAWRCFGTPVGECFMDGSPCSFSDECCCGLCSLDGAGDMVCCPGGITCVPDGDACTADIDCCSGYCNMSGICGEDEDPCVELGGTCTSASDCCSGICTDGFCGAIDG